MEELAKYAQRTMDALLAQGWRIHNNDGITGSFGWRAPRGATTFGFESMTEALLDAAAECIKLQRQEIAELQGNSLSPHKHEVHIASSGIPIMGDDSE